MTTARTGTLDAQSLRDAVASEVDAGRSPTALAVADANMELVALGILSPAHSAAGLDCLRTVMPQVLIDRSLQAGEWELRGAHDQL